MPEFLNTLVRLHIDRRAFESWNPDLHTWTLEDRIYTLNATVDSPHALDWRNRADMTLRYDGESPYSWGAQTSIKEDLRDPGTEIRSSSVYGCARTAVGERNHNIRIYPERQCRIHAD